MLASLKTFKSMPRNVWVLGIAAMLTDASSEMIHCVLPLFLVSTLGVSLSSVGVIEGVAESIASVTKMFSGALSDHFGRRKPLVLFGYGFSTLMKPLFAISQGFFSVLLARSGDRVGKGIRGAPRDALIADSVPPQQRGAAYGLRQSLDTAGAFIGPATAFILLLFAHTTYRFIFWCAVVPAVLAVIVLAAGIKEPPVKSGSGKEKWKIEQLSNLGWTYWSLALGAVVFNLGNSSDAFLLLRAQQLGVPAFAIPLALVTMNLVYSVSAYPFGALSDKIGRLNLLLIGFALDAIVYLGFAWATAAWQIWLLFALYGVYLGMTQGALSALVADIAPAELRGTAFGLLNLAIGLTLLPASLVTGVLWEHYSPAVAFSVGSLLAALGTVSLLLFFVPHYKKRDAVVDSCST